MANQTWFKDIVAQYETAQRSEGSRKSKNYASAAALYDLDATRSVKTTHEANDNISLADEFEGKSAGGESTGVEAGEEEVIELDDEEESNKSEDVANQDGLRKESSAPTEGDDFQSGDTPISVDSRSTAQDHGQDGASSAESGDAASASNQQATSTAKNAAHHESPVAGASG